MKQLNAKKISLAVGVTFGLYMLLLGLAAAQGWGTALVRTMSSLYWGYDASFVGSLIGFVWGFIDGFIGAYVFVLIYNRLSRFK